MSDSSSFISPTTRTLTRYSTREIVTDAIGLDRIDLLHGGPKALGHNPSWIKAFDVDKLLAQQDEEIARLTTQLAAKDEGIRNLQTLLGHAYENNADAYMERDAANTLRLRAQLASK